MATKDTARVNAMLSEFVSSLAQRFSDDLDFILLFGSAARGEFRAGTSDVDIIIQVKKESGRAKVEEHAENVFWELDKKHGTRLQEVCSTKQDNIFGAAESAVKLYKPFEVLGPGDIDWANGMVNSAALGPFAAIAPLSQFAKKIKKEGKVLYGRNILAEIRVRESILDKIKALLLPYLLSAIALPVFILSPDKALKYSIKAVLYSIDDQLLVIGADYSKMTHFNILVLRYEIGAFYSIRLAREALLAKKDFERIKKQWSYIDKAAFCLQAPIYIAYNNLTSVFSLRR